MTSGTGTCTVKVNRLGDANYNDATEVSASATATKINQAALTLTVPASITYGNTGTASTTGGTGTGAVSFSSAGSTGCSVNSASGVISVSNASQTCSISATKASDNNYNPVSDGPKAVTLNKATLNVAANTPTSTQYSDPLAPLTATLTGFVNGDTLATAVGGSAALTTTATQYSAPGTYPITVALGSLSAANYNFTGFTSATYTITQEDARADYSGNMLFWTTSATSTTANVTLAATIRDISAVMSDPAYDGAGDIRNATVTL
jgi:hypothetical protein